LLRKLRPRSPLVVGKRSERRQGVKAGVRRSHGRAATTLGHCPLVPAVPVQLKAEIVRELKRLELVLEMIATVETERDYGYPAYYSYGYAPVLRLRRPALLPTSAGWFSSSGWRLCRSECAHTLESVRHRAKTALRPPGVKTVPIGDPPWHECRQRFAQLSQKSPKAGIVRGFLRREHVGGDEEQMMFLSPAAPATPALLSLLFIAAILTIMA
jgi:hypothetical protein